MTAFHFTRWTQAEKDRLKELWTAGASSTAIARTLKRSWSSCRNMAKKLGLPLRNPAGVVKDEGWIQRRDLAKRARG